MDSSNQSGKIVTAGSVNQNSGFHRLCLTDSNSISQITLNFYLQHLYLLKITWLLHCVLYFYNKNHNLPINLSLIGFILLKCILHNQHSEVLSEVLISSVADGQWKTKPLVQQLIVTFFNLQIVDEIHFIQQYGSKSGMTVLLMLLERWIDGNDLPFCVFGNCAWKTGQWRPFNWHQMQPSLVQKSNAYCAQVAQLTF